MVLPYNASKEPRALWVITLVKFLGTPNNEGFLISNNKFRLLFILERGGNEAQRALITKQMLDKLHLPAFFPWLEVSQYL
jgi:hypothetical protein